MQRLLLFITILLFASLSFSQNPMPIGSWQAHLPYRYGKSVTQSESTVYYATDWSVLTIDKNELSVDFFSKVDGLSNAGIQLIKYNPFSNILVVVYTNSIIDLVKPDEVITMNYIKNFRNFTGEKIVNDIHIENDSIVYLAGSYGVSKVNIYADEFTFTTFTGINVKGVEVYDGFVYAATLEGVYRVTENNLFADDFGQWEYMGEEQGFPSDYSSNALCVFEGALYADVNDAIWKFQNGTTEEIHPAENCNHMQYLSAEGKNLLAGYQCETAGACSSCPRKIAYVKSDGSSHDLVSSCIGVPIYGIEDESGRVWLADNWSSVRVLNSLEDPVCDKLSYDSPYSESVWEMHIKDNELWLASGGLDQTLSPRFLSDGIASFTDRQWTLYNRFNTAAFKGSDLSSGSDDLFDMVSISIHPENGKVYAGSFLEGLMEYDKDSETFNHYRYDNSVLEGADGDSKRTRISGLAFDDENKLWISNHSAIGGNALHVLKNDGNWQSFKDLCNANRLFQIAIDQNSYKWIVVGKDQTGLLLFDEGEMDDPNDDRCRAITKNNSVLPSNETTCVAADLEGDVWVGTIEGIIIFECGSSAFEAECTGSKRIVDGDGLGAGYLLETEVIQTIAVDGANRKWVGTQNGVFVLSPSGEDLLYRFTADNSPLFDNRIVDIAIDQQSGEVFIATAKGLLSYQSDAVEGTRTHKANVEIYPHPVRPDYDGPIAIKGLARDATVKITDINGKLIFETKAVGGQAIWDGRDYNGRRANSGVYLVFSTTNTRHSGFENPQSVVAKILLVN